MTRKDYVAIARVIRETEQIFVGSPGCSNPDDSSLLAVIDELVDRFAVMLLNDNSRFDRERFIKACG